MPTMNWGRELAILRVRFGGRVAPGFHATVAALPRTGQGKVVRRRLLAELQRHWRRIDGPRPRSERID